jgi:hypothetical protein
MHFVDSRMFERIGGREPHCLYSRSPKDTSSNFCHLHIVDIFFDEVHTDQGEEGFSFHILSFSILLPFDICTVFVFDIFTSDQSRGNRRRFVLEYTLVFSISIHLHLYYLYSIFFLSAFFHHTDAPPDHWIIMNVTRYEGEGVGGYFQTSFSSFSLKLFRIPKILKFWFFDFFSSTFLHFDILSFGIFISTSTFYFRHFSFDLFTFDIFTLDLSWEHLITSVWTEICSIDRRTES